MATYIAPSYTLNPVKAVHVGNQSQSGQYNSGSQTVTSADIVQIAKIPHGATLLYLTADHSTGATQCALKWGLQRQGGGTAGTLLTGCTSMIVATANQAAKYRESVLPPGVAGGGVNQGIGLPALVSVTDADPLRYATLVAVSAGTTPTTSLIINWAVTYRMD
jgi:hypothetical protein